MHLALQVDKEELVRIFLVVERGKQSFVANNSN